MTLKPFDARPGATGRTADKRERKLSILYVEDEDTNWDVVLLNLRSKYELTRARDARETFKLLRKQRFDVILMDIQLSGSDFDGIKITQILKGRIESPNVLLTSGVSADDVPVIFVSAYTARYTEEYLQSVGGDALIGKPVDFVQLSLAIARYTLRRTFKT